MPFEQECMIGILNKQTGQRQTGNSGLLESPRILGKVTGKYCIYFAINLWHLHVGAINECFAVLSHTILFKMLTSASCLSLWSQQKK